MNCTFALVKNNLFFPEEVVSKAVAEMNAEWMAKFPWSGKVVLSDAHTTVWIEDETTPLMINLCNAICQAIELGSGNYPYFEMYGNVTVKIEDDFISIDGDYVEGKATFFASEAVPAFLKCVKRYLALLESITDRDARPQEDIDQLQASLADLTRAFTASVENS